MRGDHWTIALRAGLLLVVLCGGVYPAVTTLIAQGLFPGQATGSLIELDGRVVGSRLVGQPFESERYFQGRPSAVGYDPIQVSGSNLAPSNPALRARAQTTSRAIQEREGVSAAAIPVDLIAASGSGIDPHISPAAARLQVDRIARARGLPPAQVAALVEAETRRPWFGDVGRPRVNVLELNLALDGLRRAP